MLNGRREALLAVSRFGGIVGGTPLPAERPLANRCPSRRNGAALSGGWRSRSLAARALLLFWHEPLELHGRRPALRGLCAFGRAVVGAAALLRQRGADVADFAKQSVRVLWDVDETPPSVEGGGLLVYGVNNDEPCRGGVAGGGGEA